MTGSLAPILVLGFVGFVTSFGAHVVAVNLPTYAEQVGVGMAAIGLLIAVYDLAEIVAKPLFGAVADRRGMKQTMLAGIVVFTLASLAYPLVDPRLLLLVRFFQGAGAAALSAVSLALVSAYAGQARGRAYGIYNAVKGSGYLVSPVIGGVIVAGRGFSDIFLASAAIGMVALVLSALLPPPTRPGRPASRFAEPKKDGGLVGAAVIDDDDDLSPAAMFKAFRHPRLWPWYLVIVINMFFVGILFGFLPVRVHELGFDPFASGLLLTAVTASYLLVQPAAGALADRAGAERTVRAGLALSGAAIVLVPFVSGLPLVALCLAAGASIGTVWTNCDALVSSLAEEGELGATMGAAGSFKELGDMAGPLLIGVVSEAFGLPVGFVLCGLLGLAALALVSSRRAAVRA